MGLQGATSVAQSSWDQPHGGHPAQDIRVSSARQNCCPLRSPKSSPPPWVPAAGQPRTLRGVNGLLQAPGADTHQHTQQTQLQPSFTFTPFLFTSLIGNSWKATPHFLQQHSQRIKEILHIGPVTSKPGTATQLALPGYRSPQRPPPETVLYCPVSQELPPGLSIQPTG